MGAGAPSYEGDGQLNPPDKRPDAAPMLHARGAPLASARVPSARLAALLALAVTASAQQAEWTQAKKDAIDVGCAYPDACASFTGGDGFWARTQSCVNPSAERDSCACRDLSHDCVIGVCDGCAQEYAACADGYYVSYCGGTRNAELAIMESGSTLIDGAGCGCAVEGVPWPVTGVCYAYRYECRPLWGWCEVGYEWDGSKCVDENADEDADKNVDENADDGEDKNEDADKNSPSSAGISTVAIVGIAMGGLVLLSVIGAAVVINIQKSKAAQPPAPPVVAADVAMAAPAVAAPPVATPEIEIEMGEAPRARFDPQTGKPIPKFDPQTGKQNW